MNKRMRMVLTMSAIITFILPTIIALNYSPASSTGADQAAQAFRTRTPTPTRTPTATATRPAPANYLRKQLSFAIGGGGIYCSSGYSKNMRLPAVAREARDEGGFQERICVYGFEIGETVSVKIYNPAKRLQASIPLVIQDDDALLGANFPINLAYMIPLPNDAPHGRWRVVVEGRSGSAETTFTHPEDYPNLTVTRLHKATEGWYDPRKSPAFKAGDTLLVQGASLPANRDLVLALYRKTGNTNLIIGQLVSTDRQGDFQASFYLGKEFKPGEYFAVVVDNRNQETYTLDDTLIPIRVIASEKACKDAQPSILKKGDSAMISAGAPNNVREKPGLDKRLIGKLYAYERVEILLGPKCADGMVWWKVSSLNTGMDGWTAEGKNGDDWLVHY